MLGVAIPARDAPLAMGAATGPLADELAKTRLFEAFLACITELAEPSPVVLVLEDLQWADTASAELLGFLTRNLGVSTVLLVGTYRSDEVGRRHHLRPWLSELSRHPRVTHLRLGGLDRDELASMIGGILGHPPDGRCSTPSGRAHRATRSSPRS